MPRLLLLFAHPRPDLSEANRPLFERVKTLPNLTAVDLYAEYPDMVISVEREQQRLRDHDIIIFQHPFYWYSAPAILKEWMDLVLEYGFAYGQGGTALSGKSLLSVLTTGARAEAYTPDGLHGIDVRGLLTPFEKTAALCHMRYLPPVILFGAGRAQDEGRLTPHMDAYETLLRALAEDRFDLEACANEPIMPLPPDPLIRPAATAAAVPPSPTSSSQTEAARP